MVVSYTKLFFPLCSALQSYATCINGLRLPPVFKKMYIGEQRSWADELLQDCGE